MPGMETATYVGVPLEMLVDEPERGYDRDDGKETRNLAQLEHRRSKLLPIRLLTIQPTWWA